MGSRGSTDQAGAQRFIVVLLAVLHIPLELVRNAAEACARFWCVTACPSSYPRTVALFPVGGEGGEGGRIAGQRRRVSPLCSNSLPQSQSAEPVPVGGACGGSGAVADDQPSPMVAS